MFIASIVFMILGLFGASYAIYALSGLLEENLNVFQNLLTFFGVGRNLGGFDVILYGSLILLVAGIVLFAVAKKKQPQQVKKSVNIKTLTECAVMLALATVLSVIIIYEAPLGGSVTLFSMVPIILVALRHGPKWGLGTAFTYSVIQLLMGLKNLSYIPTPAAFAAGALFDYICAFTILGLAGIFRNRTFSQNKKLNKTATVIAGTLFVCILRYLCHVLIGAWIWYEITKNGNWNDYVFTVGRWTYSIVYNATFMVPETIITLIATPLIAMFSQKEKQ